MLFVSVGAGEAGGTARDERQESRLGSLRYAGDRKHCTAARLCDLSKTKGGGRSDGCGVRCVPKSRRDRVWCVLVLTCPRQTRPQLAGAGSGGCT
eukprot:3133612-Rhodomonas_salina.6